MGLSRKRTQLLAYLAGLFDGEGCVYAHGTSRVVSVGISMTEPHAIALLKREYPEFNVRYMNPKRGDGQPRKPYVNVHVEQFRAYRFLEDIKPFVLVKYEQVAVALSLLVHRRRVKHSRWLTAGQSEYCIRCAATIKALKRRNNTVKTVDALAKHGLRQYRAKPEDVELDLAQLRTIAEGLWERVETSGEPSIGNKPISAVEQDIVHGFADSETWPSDATAFK